jgi:hypothetical protein
MMIKEITIEKYNLQIEKIFKKLKNFPTNEILTELFNFASSVKITNSTKRKKKCVR